MDGFEALAIFMKFYNSKENEERKIITCLSEVCLNGKITR